MALGCGCGIWRIDLHGRANGIIRYERKKRMIESILLGLFICALLFRYVFPFLDKYTFLGGYNMINKNKDSVKNLHRWETL
jgi:hypothetical protein